MNINLDIWLVSKYTSVSTNEECLHVISDFYAPLQPGQVDTLRLQLSMLHGHGNVEMDTTRGHVINS